MDWQTILAWTLGVAAFIYVIRNFMHQLKSQEIDPKCEDCPAPDLMAKKNIRLRISP